MTVNNEGNIPANMPANVSAFQATHGVAPSRNRNTLPPDQRAVRGGTSGNGLSNQQPFRGAANRASGGADFAQILDQAKWRGKENERGKESERSKESERGKESERVKAGGRGNMISPDKASGLKISKHAEARLNDRNIQLTGYQKEKIADALVKADNKGVREALVMIDGLAIVANTRSMTVITAVSEGDLRQNIFTNIDGAVFA